jgi:hypothetical protein
MGNPRHRPERSYPDAKRVIVECELQTCIHCGEQLVPSGTWHTRKTVQTMSGPLFVAGKSKRAVHLSWTDKYRVRNITWGIWLNQCCRWMGDCNSGCGMI